MWGPTGGKCGLIQVYDKSLRSFESSMAKLPPVGLQSPVESKQMATQSHTEVMWGT